MSYVKIEKYRDLRVEENVDFTVGAASAFNGMSIHNDGAGKCKRRARVSIGTHFHCGKRCIIRTSDHDYSRGYPLVHGDLAGYKVADVEIGDYVWFGEDVLVMKGVKIGTGAIIQSRSVVVSDIPPLAIAGGHPCRPFSERTKADFEFFKGLQMSKRDKEDPEGQLASFEAALRRHRGQEQ